MSISRDGSVENSVLLLYYSSRRERRKSKEVSSVYNLVNVIGLIIKDFDSYFVENLLRLLITTGRVVLLLELL